MTADIQGLGTGRSSSSQIQGTQQMRRRQGSNRVQQLKVAQQPLGQEGGSVDALTAAINAIQLMGGKRWEVGVRPKPIADITKRVADVVKARKMSMIQFPQIGGYVDPQHISQELKERMGIEKCGTVTEALLWLTEPINFNHYFSEDNRQKMIVCAGSVYEDGTVPCVLIGTGRDQPYSLKFLVTESSTVNRFGFGLQY
ncbi:MAG TPA: hypothetical protein PLF31_03200 [Candidatus Paceibacterota bacterium]|nr:hypothetical protein [Candidatus Paceibacterota bacterium]